jgi:hypothetical protein
MHVGTYVVGVESDCPIKGVNGLFIPMELFEGKTLIVVDECIVGVKSGKEHQPTEEKPPLIAVG